ncbi:hypothetical protein Q428_05135 [Fervidicella metallireducens AeB]|uniref:CAAX prenyl protease 2/Lysostaphin resistance protein A-like domain-containing protein n=1 Tax=Fervidicella metallireducens AeB TaxID=1403537 RepID=A0A017RWG6_9CLOT|nr:CPBP family glutamic-type intramembrane protease [Fervidicella metallireducens]EYE88941.1 hypothetical protein Q428_05135 [Fervidicella metallireducens AeB]
MKKYIAKIIKISAFILVLTFFEYLSQRITENIVARILSNDYVISLFKIFLDTAAAYTAVRIFIGEYPLKKVGIKGKLNFKRAGLFVLSVFILNSVITLIIYLLGGYVFEGYIWNKFYLEDIIPILLVGIVESIGVGITSEITIRGYVFKAFDNKYIGLLISAMIYLFINLIGRGTNINVFIGLGFFSILLSLIYIYTDDLVYSIIFHSVWYFVSLYIYSTPVNGVASPGVIFLNYNDKFLFNGGDYGITASIISIVFFSIINIILFWKTKSREK